MSKGAPRNSPMDTFCVAPALLGMAVWLLWVTRSCADEALARASADSVSQFTAIQHYCPSQIPADAALAGKYADAFAVIGRKNATPVAWKRMMAAEGSRRLKEVHISGDHEWCENQRRFLEEAGVRGVLPR